MKKSIILKTLIILSIVIGSIFVGSSYFFYKSDIQLSNDIREYNLNFSMAALDERLKERLKTNEKQMKATIGMIAKNSSVFLLNYDTDRLEESLYFDMRDSDLKAVKIFDDTIKEIFMVGLKIDNRIKFGSTIPDEFIKFKTIKRPINIISDDSMDRIGYITLYYDESTIVHQINELKAEAKRDIEKFNQEIDMQKSKANKIKLYINIASLMLVLILISILLIYFVNKPLMIVQQGLDDFFLFLQNKKDSISKIELDSHDEFGQMANSLNENISVSAKLHEEIHELNTNLEMKIEQKTAKVTTLLNNAGQGFLAFNKNFMIDKEYSKECEKLLGKELAHNDISTTLFADKNEAATFKSNVKDMLNISNPIAQKSMITLLPQEIILHKRTIKIEYKVLNSNNNIIMLILTNISANKKLQKRIEEEENILKMIVTIIEDSDIFYDIKKDFDNFAIDKIALIDTQKSSLHNINNLYRAIHTFKGAFLQLFMNDTAAFLHDVESRLSEFLAHNATISNEELIEFLNKIDFNSFMQNDISHIDELLGEKFLKNDNFISIDKQVIKNIEKQYIALLKRAHISDESSSCLLDSIRYLSQKSLKSQLNSYPKLTMQIAQRLEKEIYEFEIIGDDSILVPDKFKPFIKSLIHLFRNSIDHGIETPQEREELEKDEIGTISCAFKVENNSLQIIISDDGAGINADKLKERLATQIDVSKLTTQEIYQSIFMDNISTKKRVTETSGRGVGMSAVKAELERLNGAITIQSELHIGTTFVFDIEL